MGLLQLPLDIWSSLENELDDDDLRQLCMTCRVMLDLSQRKVYRNIVMTEVAVSGDSVRAIASGPRAQFVRRITFTPNDPKPVLKWNKEPHSAYPPSEHDPSIKLSPESREVLSSLRRFPNLEAFRLQFDKWDLNSWPFAPHTFSASWFFEYHQGEDIEPWRLLLNHSFLALSDSAGAFSKLEVDSLTPVPEEPSYTAFQTAKWRKLLHGLSRLEVVVASVPDNGNGCMTVAQEGFLTSFPSNFLAHLPGVEYLRLAGNHDAVIGHYESGNPIPWAAVQIPQLRFFELEYSYLDEGLANFLVNHQNTLEKIYLRRCLAEEKSNWRELFRRVLEKNPRQLVEFTVLAYPVRKRTIYATHEEWNIAQHELEEAMRDDPEEDVEDERNRKFVVAKTCESYGAIEPKELYHDPEDDEDDESNPLDESDIVKEWDELQKLVKRNRDAARLSR